MATPLFYEGKIKVFEEECVSPEIDTEAEARDVLDQIRKEHPADKGWIEFRGEVLQRTNGKWVARREHAKYKPAAK